jgi:hypothetical protein
VSTNKGGCYWRVLLGRKFTGGKVVSKNFSSTQEARKWIFGGAAKLKADPGSLLELKARAGSLASKLQNTFTDASAMRSKGPQLGQFLVRR